MDELKQNAIIIKIEMKVCLKYESKFFGLEITIFRISLAFAKV